MKIDRSSNVLSTCHIRLRQECAVFDFKYELQPGSDTMDVIFALRALIELYRDKRRALQLAFMDLQKSFNCVPRQCVCGHYDWKTCLKHIIRDMYRNSAAVVRASDVKTYPFLILSYPSQLLLGYTRSRLIARSC